MDDNRKWNPLPDTVPVEPQPAEVKKVFLTKLQQFQLFTEVDKMREEIVTAKMSSTHIIKRLKSLLQFEVNKSHVISAAKELGILLQPRAPRGMGQYSRREVTEQVLRQQSEQLQQHEEAIVKLRGEVARLTSLLEDIVTTPGVKYTLVNGKLCAVREGGK